MGRLEQPTRMIRRHFEVCVFSYLAAELRSGDVCVLGSENYADYREQLLSWSECQPLVPEYCQNLSFSNTASGFVEQLKSWLIDTATSVDAGYPDNRTVVINELGEPVLKRPKSSEVSLSVKALEAAIAERLPERNLIDILRNVDYWTDFTRHFGPLSGSDPKLERATERYLLTTFTYGCNLGPTQAARHMRGIVVFALSYLLGIKLMPRIRNWQDLIFYRPDTETVYQHIDSLFKESIDWSRIAIHWNDLLRVVLSIQTGKISSSILLRKLGNYSRKNLLYQAFQELGRVVRTVFLLQYISDMQLRQQITAVTNKVEAYHGFAKWFFFGGEGVIANNDPEEQEKIIKYNDLIANAVVFHNAVDLTEVLRQLKRESYLVMREDVAALSPYMTSQIKRFGDYLIDLDVVPPALDEGMTLVF